MADKKKVRVYRGEGKPSKPLPDWIQQGQKDAGITDATGRWWTTNKDMANWYVKEAGKRGRMVAQDIPEEVVNEHVVSKAKRDVAKFSRDPNNEIFLPKEYVGKGRELHMAEIKSSLLEKAKFGRFQKENREALDTLDKEKRTLRTKRKLKHAKERASQVKVKFKEQPYGTYSEEGIPNIREAKIKVGNQVSPIRATFRYNKEKSSRELEPNPNKKGSYRFKKTPAEINVHGVFSTKSVSQEGTYTRQYADTQNKVFKPGQLQQVLGAVKKRYPKAAQIFGERISGSRANKLTETSAEQVINLNKLGKKMKGKKLGIAGLGFTLGEAIRAGMDAYKTNEDKL